MPDDKRSGKDEKRQAIDEEMIARPILGNAGQFCEGGDHVIKREALGVNGEQGDKERRDNGHGAAHQARQRRDADDERQIERRIFEPTAVHGRLGHRDVVDVATSAANATEGLRFLIALAVALAGVANLSFGRRRREWIGLALAALAALRSIRLITVARNLAGVSWFSFSLLWR